MQETWVQGVNLGLEDPLEKEMATHSLATPNLFHSCTEKSMDGGAWQATEWSVACM